jgi:lipoprotein NlpD
LVGETLQIPGVVTSKNVPATAVQNNSNNAERDYNNIPKGEYTGAKYTVKQGDTLYYIAWISNTSYQELAALNQIAAPYALRVGEVLKLPSSNINTTVATPIVSTVKANNTNRANTGATSISKSLVNQAIPTPAAIQPTQPSRPVSSARVSSTANSNIQSISQSKQTDGILWQWPTQGTIIQTFTNSSSDSKGIDIGGKKGQAIYAAAAGKVVYAGDALKGYGNLIIIKHNEDYLTAYAHNDKMLVKEGQDVQRGEKIATMGSTGINQVELHFEIRYKGKAVDPQTYLP